MSYKILHVCGRTEGGIGQFVRSILRQNDGRGPVHDLFLTHASGQEPPPPHGRTFSLDYRAHSSYAIFRKVREAFRSYDAFMIHAAHPLTVLALLLLRKRCLLFQHGMAVSSGPAVNRALKRWWYTLLPWLLDARVVCSTEYAYDKARRLGIRLRPERVSIVPFGMSMRGRAKPVRRERPPGVIRVGMAGRLVKQKRQDLVIKSLAAYAGGTKIHLKIAGEGPEQAHLAAVAAFDNPAADVTFLGYVRDMDAFYDDIDLLVFPSEGESFGLVAIEAFSRGIPVAVFPDVGGCLSVIRAGENGFVMPDGLAGLAALWNQLDAEPALLGRLSEQIARMDLSPYDIARTRAELERLAGCVEAGSGPA